MEYRLFITFMHFLQSRLVLKFTRVLFYMFGMLILCTSDMCCISLFPVCVLSLNSMVPFFLDCEMYGSLTDHACTSRVLSRKLPRRKIREMQMETTRSNFTLTLFTKLCKSDDHKCRWRSRTPPLLLVGT